MKENMTIKTAILEKRLIAGVELEMRYHMKGGRTARSGEQGWLDLSSRPDRSKGGKQE
jgi:hypothetical protein